MAKYLLLKHYRGAPAPVNDVPMDRWAPAEVEAHIKYMNDFAARLQASGEYVDRPVRRDQGPHRRLDDDRRGQLRAGPRVGR